VEIVIKTIEKNSSKKKMLRVCAYVRVSTDNSEQLDSFETQEAHYKSLIKRNPAWEFVGIYSDEGISGTKTDGRFGLQEMMADSRAGKIDLILTKSLSRFARNTVDALSLIRQLIKLGVCIRFEKENIDTSSMESELILSIMASLAEEESRSTSQNLKWSIKRSFENGTYLPNYLPYGYVYDGEEIVINDSEAEIVRFLFEESLNGKGGFRLAKDLNHRKVPPIRSKAWSRVCR
jgi:site-specific DNA recombinase